MTHDPRDTNKVLGTIELALGVLLLALATFLWLRWLGDANHPLETFGGEELLDAGRRPPEPAQLLVVTLSTIITLAIVGLSVVAHATVVLVRRHRARSGEIRRISRGPTRSAVPKVLQYVPYVGYRTFVAWRYLLVFEHKIARAPKVVLVVLVVARLLLWKLFGVGLTATGDLGRIAGLLNTAIFFVWFFGVLRHAKLATFVFVLGVVCALTGFSVAGLVELGKLGALDAGQARQIEQVFGIVMIIGALLAFLAGFFGTLRAYFTFFTTVPIGGVWIGTTALVIVLAVMSGFESDLRDKILGSNAHIQVTKEHGEFTNWRQVKAKIDKIPGVVASTPYAVSEVVIAANNNGMNVIIKGIDPNSVGKVTDLVNDISEEDKVGAMRRLEPLIDLGHDTTVKTAPPPDNAIDPPPDDLIMGGDPIDFSGDEPGDEGDGSNDDGNDDNGDDAGSGSAAAAGSGSDTSNAGSGSGPVGDPDTEPVSPYGGDAVRIVGDVEGKVLDLLDSDLIRWMVGEGSDEGGVHVIDVGPEPSISRRTQALPGILVGAELVKQTHLYTGEEVRVVSPLSDPSNPDATGTPIPFNRDYRVAGKFYTGMYEYDLKYVYVTLDSLQDFLDLGDSVDGIEIRVGSADDTGRYIDDGDQPGLISKALGPGYRVQDWRDLNRSLFSALKLEKIAMFAVLVIVILVASFSIIGNLIMVVVEKGREIALLKTLGASDFGVMQMFAVQGLIIGLIGTVLGISSGLLGCLAIQRYGLPLNPDVYYIDRLPIHIDPGSVVGAAITGVAISILATLYPAALAARIRPAIGMRH